jgi:hypothetical protein
MPVSYRENANDWIRVRNNSPEGHNRETMILLIGGGGEAQARGQGPYPMARALPYGMKGAELPMGARGMPRNVPWHAQRLPSMAMCWTPVTELR